MDAAFAHENAIQRHPLPQPNRMVQIDLERFQVAIIHADQRRASRQNPIQILRLIKFNERRQPSSSASLCSLRRLQSSRHSAISSTASAPAARASTSW